MLRKLTLVAALPLAGLAFTADKAAAQFYGKGFGLSVGRSPFGRSFNLSVGRGFSPYGVYRGGFNRGFSPFYGGFNRYSSFYRYGGFNRGFSPYYNRGFNRGFSPYYGRGFYRR